MATSSKNIRYFFRHVNFHVDAYLRRLIAVFPEKICHAGVDPYQDRLRGAIASINYEKDPIIRSAHSRTTSRDRFITIVKKELAHGKRINELSRDHNELLTYALHCQRWVIEQMRGEGLDNAEIVRAISYLLEIASRKQKGGQRGVLKSRPVVFERVFSYLYPNRKPPHPLLTKERTRGEVSFDLDFKYRIGGIIEMYNRATYAIDDVFDDSDYRAGAPTLHKVFNEKIAIHAGQFLHMWSLALLLNELTCVPPHIREEVIRSFNIIHTSIYQMEVENYDLQEKLCNDFKFHLHYLKQPMKKKVEYYLKRVDLRTGKFYEHIVRMAVLLATNNISLANEWQAYGLGLGFRYLIDNDLKDLIDPYYVKQGTGSQGLKGKEHESFMGDLEIGKITYPVLFAFKKNFDTSIVRMIGKKLTLEEKNEITKFIIDNGGVDATLQLMEHHAYMSQKTLKKLGVNDANLWELTELYKFSNLPFEKFKQKEKT